MLLEHFVSGTLGENMFLIGADGIGRCAAIDPGEAEPLLAALKERNLLLEAILLTHGHFDHIGGVRRLQHETGAKVYIHEADAKMLSSGRLSLAALTASRVEPSEADVLLRGGEVLGLAGLQIGVIHTPGHTKGGVCYVLKNERKLFSGDTLFHGDAGRTDFPGGSANELRRSILEGLYSLEGDYAVYPGHEEFTTLNEERERNSLVRAGERRG